MQGEKVKIHAIETMRTVSILAVLLIHTTTRTIETTHNNLSGYPWTLFLNQISRFAVPLFFIISGFVLELNYNNHSGYFSYLKKRVGKILIPYIFWSLIYYYFIYNQNHDNLMRVFLTGNASYQLYFIPTVALFYLAFPLLHKIHKQVTSFTSLIILFISQIYFLYRDYFIKEYNMPDPLRIILLNYFVFIFGMFVARNKDRILTMIKKWKYYLLVFCMLLGVYVFWEGKSDFLKTGNYLSFYSQYRPSILIYSVSVFALILYIFEKPHRQFNIIERISRLSYLVFFIHVILLEEIWKYFGKNLFFLLNENVAGKLLFDPVFFFFVATSSFFIAYLIHRIPKIYKLTG